MKTVKIAILSGKGGTGKTFVAVNLANVIKNSTYIDCDIEEPNGGIFFNPENIIENTVNNLIPQFNNDNCIGCRKCVDFCQYNALAIIDNKVKLFENLCHSCGGCELVCDYDAISFKEKAVGKVSIGKHNDMKIVSGELNIGIISGNSIINQAISYSENTTIIDCPPGSGCEVMDTIRDVDYCIIIVEPTLFSYSNYLLVKELVNVMKKNYSIIINKNIEDSEIIYNDNILARIPYTNSIAKKLSNGKIITDNDKNIYNIFNDIKIKLFKELDNV